MTADLRYRLRLLRLLTAAGPVAVALCLLFLVQSLLLPLTAVATGLLVRQSTHLSAADLSGLVWPLVFLGGVLVAGQVVEQFGSPLRFATVRRVDEEQRAWLCRAATASPGIGMLEDPAVQDDLVLASANHTGWTERTPGEAAIAQVWVLSGALTAIFAAAVVARYSWWLVAVLVLPAIVTRTLLRRQNLTFARVWASGVPQARRAQYWMQGGAHLGVAKETRLYGLGGWLVDRWRRHELAHLRPTWRAGEEIGRRQWVVFALSAVAAFASLCVLGVAAASGRLSAADLAATLTALLGVLSFGAMDPASASVALGAPVVAAGERIRRRLAAAGTTAAVENGAGTTAAVENGAGTTAAVENGAECSSPASRPPSIRFNNVTFRYPGAARPVLDGVDLEIRPGEVLGLVGVNGSGKSTLIKLLARLYQPDLGTITADGVDVSTVDVERWRAGMAVVFQDFVRYQLTAADNVTLGAPRRGRDDSVLAEVAREAGLQPMLDRLPKGWDTPLSSGLAGGVDLSGGQWQHVALARALFAVGAGGRVLVLDEPTAHLDVRTEMEVFRRLVHGVSDVTVVLISHRLSTLRQADRIAMLSAGRIVEVGTHDELVAAGGDYAALFAAQSGPSPDQPLYLRADSEVGG